MKKGTVGTVPFFLAFIFLFATKVFAFPGVDVIFVTSPPNPSDFATAHATFGNHRATMYSAPRGGDLYIRYSDGTLKNLTQAAGYGGTGNQGANAIAVRDPSVHWDAQKVIFSMVVGGPSSQYQVRDYYFQLYEITGLGINDTPVITKVPNQPTNYNNVMPIYGTDDRIIFASDRLRSGERHLYPQLDEYESTPTNTGLWSLDPQSGDLFMLDHSPSGDFDPIIDSFGRVIFTRWDHLQQDQQQDAGSYSAFDALDESETATYTTNTNEVFPEPRSSTDPNRVSTIELHTINHFFPWQINEDGTEHETLNHIGRHELHSYFNLTFNNDSALQEQLFLPREDSAVQNFFHITEDLSNPGRFYAINAPEFGTHSAGQLVSIDGAPSLKAGDMFAVWKTHPDTRSTSDSPSVNHSGLYRDPFVLSDGTIIASHTSSTRQDSNIGTTSNPQSRHDYRLKTLKTSGSYLIPDQNLTSGIQKNISFWSPDVLVSYSGVNLWELQPQALVARSRPSKRSAQLPAIENTVFTDQSIDLNELRQYLVDNNLALIISRNLTTRDSKDKQQPFNLKVANSSTETVTTTGRSYEIAFMQMFQGDLVRGYGGVSDPDDGRRVLARTLHDSSVVNPPIEGERPDGSVQIASDGSMAAFVPARRALTWHLTDSSGNSVVKERYWLTFQPGEIRVCASCHGVTSTDQVGRQEPTNAPEALRLLLDFWKSQPHDKPTFTLDVKGQGNSQKLKAGKKFKINVTGNTTAANRSVELYLSVKSKQCSGALASFAMSDDSKKILNGLTPKASRRMALKFTLKYNRKDAAIAQSSLTPIGRFTPIRKGKRAAQSVVKICKDFRKKLK